MYQVDLNCDLGESFGNYTIGRDAEVLNFITSANIACGFHAGDPIVMKKTVDSALSKGVVIGAHPGYPDLIGFGRRNMSISAEEAKAYMIYQIGALNAFVRASGGKLQHVKPHGALYNTAAIDYTLARALAEAVYTVDCDLVFLGLANSMMIKAAEDVGLKAASEVFADRAYNRDGSLVSRNIDGSIIHDADLCLQRVLRMVMESRVQSIDGHDIEVKANSICIHGDNTMALEFAQKLKTGLSAEGISIKALR